MVRKKLLDKGLNLPDNTYVWCKVRNLFVTLGWCFSASVTLQDRGGDKCLGCSAWKVEMKANRVHKAVKTFYCTKRNSQMYKAVCNVHSFKYNPLCEECFKCTDWMRGEDAPLLTLFLDAEGVYLDPTGIYKQKMDLRKAMHGGKKHERVVLKKRTKLLV